MITLKTATLDGKPIGYCSETVFEIQVGKGPKGAYKTRSRVVGNFGQAIMQYNMINIGNGCKKRLFCGTMSRPVLARARS
jgi:hypothetical protein